MRYESIPQPICVECGAPRSYNSGRRCKACYTRLHHHDVPLKPRRLIIPPEPRLIEAAKASVLELPTDEQLIPMLLYQGNVTFGRTRAMYGMLVGAMNGAVEPRPIRLSDASTVEDFRHYPGLHSPVQGNSFYGFVGRLLDNPEVLNLTPRLEDYVHEYQRLGGQTYVPFNRIDRWTRDSHLRRQWRWLPREPREPRIKVLHLCIDCGRKCFGERCRECYSTPLPQVWPFVGAGDRDDHAMLLAIDAVVPKTLPEALRQDICQDLVLAVLTGDVDISDLATATPRFIKQVFQQYPSKYGPISLDSPAPWASEDNRTFGELLEVR